MLESENTKKTPSFILINIYAIVWKKKNEILICVLALRSSSFSSFASGIFDHKHKNSYYSIQRSRTINSRNKIIIHTPLIFWNIILMENICFTQERIHSIYSNLPGSEEASDANYSTKQDNWRKQI